MVQLKTVSGSGADATGGESPFHLCLLNPSTIWSATVVGLPVILAVVEVPKGWSMSLPSLAVRHVSMGKLLEVVGELPYVRINMNHLQTESGECHGVQHLQPQSQFHYDAISDANCLVDSDSRQRYIAPCKLYPKNTEISDSSEISPLPSFGPIPTINLATNVCLVQ